MSDISPKNPSRILIVEDEAIVALNLRSVLELAGYEVVGTVSRGADVVDRAMATRPDLVLMDIHLADDVLGTEAARRLRERSDVPVIFLTAYDDRDTLSTAGGSAPHGYLIKPFEPRALEVTIQMALVRYAAESEVRRSEERLSLALDAAGMGVVEWDSRSGRMATAGATMQIIGRPPTAFVEQADALVARVHPDDRTMLETRLRTEGAVSAVVRLDYGLRDGQRWIEVHAKAHENGDPEARRVIGVMRDVTEARHADERLRQASAVMTVISEGIVVTDEDLRIVSVNPAFTEITGYRCDEVLGLRPDEILHARRRGDHVSTGDSRRQLARWSGEVSCRRKNGDVFPAWEHFCAVENELGKVTHCVLAFSDIGALRRSEGRLSHMAYHDQLTGLGNRNKLLEKLTADLESARQRQAGIGLLFIDLDGFKLVNDTLGHAVGDVLLRTIAERIRMALRTHDDAVRLGGDEFVVVLGDARSAADCECVAAKLLNCVRESVSVGHEQVTLSASIGIAVFPEHGSTPEDLICAADSAMYAAKSAGRNGYAVFGEEMALQARERLTLEQGLARALESGDSLEVYYQPVVSLETGRVVGLEALARWMHPTLGVISPAKFIPIAEHSGMIDRLGTWVMREACRQVAQWATEGIEGFRIAVNVSPKELGMDSFVERVSRTLAATGLHPGRLEVEVTETSLHSIERSRTVLAELKQLGVQIAIDDFGTGFSSLSMLKQLPLDRVKIDQSFVRGLPDDGSDLQITRAIAALCGSLGLAMTAEGIENTGQRDAVAALGCQDGQGYLFSPPMPAAVVSAWLHANASLPGPVFTTPDWDRSAAA